MAENPFDEMYDGVEDVVDSNAPKRAALVVGRVLTPEEFAAKFVKRRPEHPDPIFEIVNADGSVTILGLGDPTPTGKSWG